MSEDLTIYNLTCPEGHRYTGYSMMVGTACWTSQCGKPLTISQPEGETMQETPPFGESSGVEHQALNLADGGSNPPPRSEEVDYHFHSTVGQPAEPPSGVGESADPPAFEAGHVGGSTPPTRTEAATPRRGYEMDLASGDTFGWFEMEGDRQSLTTNGQITAVLSADEWWTFLTYAYDPDPHEAGTCQPPGADTPSSQVRDLQARNDWQAQTIRRMGQLDDAQQETIRLAAERVAELTAENTELRKSLAEALQAIEESTEVIRRQTEETGYLVAEATRLRAALEGYPGEVDRWKRMARQNAEERDEYRSQLDAARDDIEVLRSALRVAQGKPPTLKLTVERPERGVR